MSASVVSQQSRAAPTRLTASHQALATLASTVRREAFVMSYSDGFFLVGLAWAARVLFVWFCSR